MGKGVICLRVLFTISVLLALNVGLAEAQYFGRNKVEYVDFEFRVLETEHFDVYHYAREEAAARIAARLAERWYARFSRLLGHEFIERQPLVLYGSHPEFVQTNVVSGLLSDTVGGVTESSRRRIVMPFAPTLAETNRVLGHELAHAFQFDIARRSGGGMNQPLWFVEGMAEYLARGRSDAEVASVASRRRRRARACPNANRTRRGGSRPTTTDMRSGRTSRNALATTSSSKPSQPGKQRRLRDRMTHATGVDLDVLFADWRARSSMRARDPRPQTVDDTPHFQAGASGKVQLGPALSPDGRHVVFFSERDQFALDLFLAEVATGRIVRKLATTTASARFDSLQPLRSAGSWSPDGDWFAFSAMRQGRPTLVLLDMRRQAAGSRDLR